MSLMDTTPPPPPCSADAERGFAVGVPNLRRGRIHAVYLDCGESNRYGYRTVGDNFWGNWNDSVGKLTRLLLIEATAKKLGFSPEPFRGRCRGEDTNTDKASGVNCTASRRMYPRLLQSECPFIPSVSLSCRL
jgi:hypothetical protein